MSPPGLRRKAPPSLWLVSLCNACHWLVKIFWSSVWLTRPWRGPQDGQCRCQTLGESILGLAKLREAPRPLEVLRGLQFSLLIKININSYSAVSIPRQWVTDFKVFSLLRCCLKSSHQRLLKVKGVQTSAMTQRGTHWHWPRLLTRS